jgi:hypothetical protein
LIERFNFYDVYGYFLPGAALLTLIWLPFGVSERLWPPSAFSSAIAAFAFAYVLGHVLQTVATGALPSKGKDSKGARRYPSDVFLDPEDKTFSTIFKQQLQQHVSAAFNVDLNVDQYAEKAEVSARRSNAFFLCRGVLIRANIASYSEQFEGMYALMRGLATAFWLSAAYLAGWAAASAESVCIRSAVGIVALASFGLAVVSSFVLVFAGPRYPSRSALDKATLLLLLVALFSSGARLGVDHHISRGDILLYSIVSLVALFAGARCYASYKYFAEEFAKAVWRDFLGYKAAPVTPAAG